MEGLVREMQDPETGVPVRCQKLFLTSIPSAFMGYDLIEWLMDRLNIEESVEALHIGNLLCQYGYFFPVNDTKNLMVKDDSSLYRFQVPFFWPWQPSRQPDNVEYAIYLVKRTLRNKQRHGLEEYEMDALASLKKNLQNKWDVIVMQADEQVRKAKNQKKCDKVVADSQERAFWRVNRPPPGCIHSLEYIPVPNRNKNSKPKRRTIEDARRDVEFLRRCLDRTRVKMSQALDSLMQYCDLYCEWDPMTILPLPSNPWVSEDPTFWMINSPLVDIPTEKRVRRWAISMEELVSDPTGLQEFTNYLRKEYSHENIRFWLAVNDLRRSSQREIPQKVQEIYKEFLAPGAPCEVNIDGKTMERTQQELKCPSRFTFDHAAEHVYTLLLKKDCYPRFVRSEMYKNLLAAGVQPSAKKRFFGFVGPAKKKSSNQPQATLQQQQSTAASLSQQVPQGQGTLVCRRRGSDRSLSGSAHELAVSGVRDKDLNRTVSHSHSQSNLSDIPYRDPPGGSSDEGAGPGGPGGSSGRDDVCPWDSGPSTALTCPEQGGRTSRKNSSQLDSGGSSSDISIAIAEVSERLRKSCYVQQQHSVTGSPGPGPGAGRLAAGYRDMRRASESLVSGRPSVSSSEDLTTPQRSFDSTGPGPPGTSTGTPRALAPSPPTSSSAPVESKPTPTAMGPSLPEAEEADEEEDDVMEDDPPPQPPPPAKPILQPPTPSASSSAPAEDKPPPPCCSSAAVSAAMAAAAPPRQDSKEDRDRERPVKFEDRGQQTGPELSRSHRSHKDKKVDKKHCVACATDPSHCSFSRTTKKSHSCRKKSSSAAGAPLISVSSVVDDTFDNSDETVRPSDSAPSAQPSAAEVPAGVGFSELTAPLAQQEDESTAPPSPSASASAGPSCAPPPPLAATRSEDRASVERGSSTEGKVNEICPWEDEESCKVDEPFTKKYSHFGYL